MADDWSRAPGSERSRQPRQNTSQYRDRDSDRNREHEDYYDHRYDNRRDQDQPPKGGKRRHTEPLPAADDDVESQSYDTKSVTSHLPHSTDASLKDEPSRPPSSVKAKRKSKTAARRKSEIPAPATEGSSGHRSAGRPRRRSPTKPAPQLKLSHPGSHQASVAEHEPEPEHGPSSTRPSPSTTAPRGADIAEQRNTREEAPSPPQFQHSRGSQEVHSDRRASAPNLGYNTSGRRQYNKYGPGPRGLRGREVNHIPVTNPKMKTRLAEEDELEHHSNGNDQADNGWDTNDDRMKRWASTIPPAATPNAAPTPVPESATDAESTDGDSVPRPNSAQEPKTPVKGYYTEDISSPEAILIRRRTTATPSPSPEAKTPAEQVIPPPPPPTQATRPPSDAPSNHGSAKQDHPPLSHFNPDTPIGFLPKDFPSPPPSGPTILHGGRRGNNKFWKRDTHPAYSLLFNNRRLMVIAPFPIRNEEFKSLLYDHFSKWGAIRCVLPFERDSTSSDKFFVVYHHANALNTAMSDPKRCNAFFKSTSRTKLVEIELVIKRLPRYYQGKFLWVKLSGPRSDARARSASPPPLEHEHDSVAGLDRRPLPARLEVWARPKLIPRQLGLGPSQVVWYPFLGSPDMDIKAMHKKDREDTQHDPRLVNDYLLERRVAEKDFLPGLIDDFCDILEVQHPCEHTNWGWVFACGPRESVELAESELNKIPGISAHIFTPDEAEAHEAYLHAVETGFTTKNIEAPQPKAPAIQRAPTVQSEDQPQSIASGSPHSHAADVDYPFLTREVVLTYRGRRLREVHHNGTSRFVDDAAVFVGRLAKGQETRSTLLNRFERYGKIAQVEFSKGDPMSTYATGRILFHDPKAASLAIMHENSANSFGNIIRVEPRRVLPHDVEAREMFIDAHGRAISPSIVSQYSPSQYSPSPSPPSPAPAPMSSQMTQPFPWMISPVPTPAPIAMPGWAPGYAPEHNQQDQMAMMMPMMWQIGYAFAPASHQMQRTIDRPGPTLQTATTTPAQTPGQPATQAPPSVPAKADPQTPTQTTKKDASAQSSKTPTQATVKTSLRGGVSASSRRTASSVDPEKKRPRVLTTKMEDGMFKPVYDPQELEEWRKDNSIPSAHASNASSTEALPLLPISTGGHDPERSYASSRRSAAGVHRPSTTESLHEQEISKMASAMGRQYLDETVRGASRKGRQSVIQDDGLVPVAVPFRDAAGALPHHPQEQYGRPMSIQDLKGYAESRDTGGWGDSGGGGNSGGGFGNNGGGRNNGGGYRNDGGHRDVPRSEYGGSHYPGGPGGQGQDRGPRSEYGGGRGFDNRRNPRGNGRDKPRQNRHFEEAVRNAHAEASLPSRPPQVSQSPHQPQTGALDTGGW